MNVLLFGGGGQLGSEIQRRWETDVDAPSHAEVDIAEENAIDRIIGKAYDLVVNCAAFHNVDACERQPDDAFRYNAVAVGRLAEACARKDVPFLTIGTDYVFSGDSDRPYGERACPNPIQTYGVSKLAGEQLALRYPHTYVVRTCGLYGIRSSTTKGYTFIDRILSQLRAGEPASVVSDVVASPTYAGHLAEALWKLVQTKAYGVYHAVNPGPVTWYDFASEAARQAGIDRTIEPISASQWTAPARRPRFSALANERLEGLGITLPGWREGVSAYLHDKSVADASA